MSIYHIFFIGQKTVCVTSLLICQGLLWVGTAQGIIVTLPVPRLEGIPKITGEPQLKQTKHCILAFFVLPNTNASSFSSGKGMTSLNAHNGPVEFLVATSSILSQDFLKRDCAMEGADSSSGAEDKEATHSSQESLQQADGSPQREAKAKGVLLQYHLRSTSQLPGKLLTARPKELSDSTQDSLEHTLEDGSIYELSDDPEVWVRGPGPGSSKETARREKVTSAAVISGGKGFRRLANSSNSSDSSENMFMVWQLPITVWSSNEISFIWLSSCFFAVMEDCWIIEGQTDCKPVWLMRIIYSTSPPEGFEGIFQVQKKLICDSICGIRLISMKKIPSLRKKKNQGYSEALTMEVRAASL